MRQLIRWQAPEHLFVAKAKQNRAGLWRSGVRIWLALTGLAVLAALVVRSMLPGHPPAFFHLLWIVVLQVPALLALFYAMLYWLLTRQITHPSMRCWHKLSREGVHRSDTSRSWKQYDAFDIEPHNEDSHCRDIVFYGKRGFHTRLTLPRDELDDLIIRFTAKHLPLVDELPDPERVRSKATPVPVWIRWCFGVLNTLYGIAVGYITSQRINPDIIELLLYGVLFINPATMAVAFGEWTGWLRRKRMNYGLWLISLAVLTIIALTAGLILGH